LKLKDRIDVHSTEIAKLAPEKRKEFIANLTDEEVLALKYDWAIWARPDQLPPVGDWFVWLIKGGRGSGKTRPAAEWIRKHAENMSARRIALIGDTAADVRDVMVGGDSGILAVSDPRFMPVYEPSKRLLTWPNGVIATCYAAEAPEMLRGPQHDLAWADEPAKWKNLRKTDNEGGTAWDNLLFGLRQGIHPRCVCSTTPRPIKWYKDLLANSSTVVTGSSTYANRANLAPTWFEQVVKKYEGTRLGRQEIHAELLDDIEGALWQRQRIDELRVATIPELIRIVVALDPAVTSNEDSDEVGIITAGLGKDGHGYVLDDTTLRASPNEWAKQAISTYSKHKADKIIAEANNGGDLIEAVLRVVNKDIPYSKVTASRGKQTRAEPVAALYEQGKVHHVGQLAYLEDEMCSWVPGMDSPNRMDALVWALSELMLNNDTFEILF
jgi:predicted phage terminase large subunit-like protein